MTVLMEIAVGLIALSGAAIIATTAMLLIKEFNKKDNSKKG